MSNIGNVYVNTLYESGKKFITDEVTTAGITYIGYATRYKKPTLTSEEKRDLSIIDETVAGFAESKRPIDLQGNYINTQNLVRDDRATYTYA